MMENKSKFIKVLHYLGLSLVFVIGLIAIIGTGGCGGGSSGGSDGGGGSTSLTTGEFTKTLTLADNLGWMSPFQVDERHLQQLYLASDINGAGYIHSIELRLNTATATGCNCPDTTIKIGHTSLGVLTNTFADNTEQGKGSLETVHTGAFSVPAGSAGDYFTIILDTPFLYNGVDNLVVDFSVAFCDENIFLWTDNTAAVHRMLQRWDLVSSVGDLYMYIMHTKFNFEGGTKTVICADKTVDNAISIAPGNTGRTQMLLMASDIDGSGPITGLSIFPYGATSTATEVSSISVSMIHVTAASLTNTFADNYGGNIPVMVAENVSYNIDVGQSAAVWIPFNVADFTYDGASNLLIDLSATVTSGGYTVDYKNVPDIRVVASSTTTAVTGATNSRVFEPILRFNGGTMDVITAEDLVWFLPFSNGADYKTQILFGSQQLGTGGPVTGISFRLGADSVASDYPAASVVLGHTANATLSMTFTDNMTDPTTVFTGTLNIPNGLRAGDWYTIPVSGFTYDSTRNLVVEVTQDAGTFGNSILVTNLAVPGASGIVTGPRANLTGITSSPGQTDIQIHLSK